MLISKGGGGYSYQAVVEFTSYEFIWYLTDLVCVVVIHRINCKFKWHIWCSVYGKNKISVTHDNINSPLVRSI